MNERTKEHGRQSGALAAKRKNRCDLTTVSLYHRLPQNVNTPHIVEILNTAQRYAAAARQNWRAAIACRQAAEARRFFCLAMRHQMIADHVAQIMERGL